LYTLAAGLLVGLSEEELRRGLLSFSPEGMRQRVCELGRITVIEDCYNASPESMIAAIDVLDAYSRQNGRRSVAVLGDMLELGQESPALHRSVGVHLAQRGIDRLFTLGEGGDQIAIGARQKGMPLARIQRRRDVKDLSGMAELLSKELKDGDVVLFKASRGVHAEEIISQLREILEKPNGEEAAG
ncbi:MAG: UDP-N-acetylmuramoyl-tripeptide--D-alanyl-D-alanine ligase, partial [Clostridia bacterium]|nr:UDP-N-acetylmuramoyl-tripeptide--D-alanyl-D-alanine ligase [Clostridia bacterium]